jgi:hypothetical protein
VIRRTPMLNYFPISDPVNVHAFNEDCFIGRRQSEVKTRVGASGHNPGGYHLAFGDLISNRHAEIWICRSDTGDVSLGFFRYGGRNKLGDPSQIAGVYDCLDEPSNEKLRNVPHMATFVVHDQVQNGASQNQSNPSLAPDRCARVLHRPRLFDLTKSNLMLKSSAKHCARVASAREGMLRNYSGEG